jgi:hypothetical protein
MKRIAALLVLLALPLAAQEQKKEPERRDESVSRKVFVLKYADPYSIAELLKPFGGQVSPNQDMHAVSVVMISGAMPAVEEAIQKLDVPAAAPKDLDIAVWLVMAGEAQGTAGEAIPKELDSLITQLKSGFTFQAYRLLDVLNLRTRAGTGGATNSAGGAVEVNKGVLSAVETDISINRVTVSGDGTVQINGLRTDVKFPAGPRLTLRTDVDVKEGQKVVVGRLGMRPGQALFLVLTARVVQ